MCKSDAVSVHYHDVRCHGVTRQLEEHRNTKAGHRQRTNKECASRRSTSDWNSIRSRVPVNLSTPCADNLLVVRQTVETKRRPAENVMSP
jgi:hypothetical protein